MHFSRRIITTNAHKAISSNHTTYHDAMGLHKWLIGVSGLYSDEDWPRRDLKTQNSKFHFRNGQTRKKGRFEGVLITNQKLKTQSLKFRYGQGLKAR